MLRRVAGLAALCLSVAMLPGAGQAQSQAAAKPYSAMYVFGDSLSDRGNLAEALGGNFPSPPFYHDSFTNGPVAVQVMAQKLGLTEDPSLFVSGFTDLRGLGLTPGTNYAVAGATAGSLAGVPGANLQNQFAAYLAKAGGSAAGDALYTVFIGGNDVRTAAHDNNAAFVTGGEAAESSVIAQLIAAGAKNVLVVNVPDVGAIPEFQQLYPSQAAAASSYSVQYNQALAGDVAAIGAANSGVNLKLFDLYGFNSKVSLASLGITNTTDPCYTNTSVTAPSAATSAGCGGIDPATGQAANIGQFEYWDYVHPTAKVHETIGDALAAFVTPAGAVPEPGTWAMLVLGMGAVGVAIRRRAPRDRAAAA